LPSPELTAHLLQFGQTGRISIGSEGIRTVTWVAAPRNELIELHFRSAGRCICTIWNGAPGICDAANRQFADRVRAIEASPFHAAAIVLQLLLGTLFLEIGGVDEAINALSQQVRERPDQVKIDEVSRERDRLRSIWLRLERYDAAVSSATVGVEASWTNMRSVWRSSRSYSCRSAS
jgi:hypothetical protein